MYKEHLK